MVQHLHRRPGRHIRRGGCYGHLVNIVFVIAVMRALTVGLTYFVFEPSNQIRPVSMHRLTPP
jgi:hypothetical protein